MKLFDQPEIDPKSTLIAPRSAGDLVAKLGGTGYARRIIDLHRSNPFLRSHEEAVPDSWYESIRTLNLC
jgi:translation initiation factor 2-alpha kinase 4